MKQYEYKLLKDTDGYYDINDVNKLGKEGWRVVWTQITDSGHEKTLFEREL